MSSPLFSGSTPQQARVLVQFKTRFSNRPVFSDLILNPQATRDELIAAIAVNIPAPFLPQPWPVYPSSDDASLKANAIIKMKYVVGISTAYPQLHAAMLKDVLAHSYPQMLSLDTLPQSLIDAEVRLQDDGQITSSFSIPVDSIMPAALLPTQDKPRPTYMFAMIVLALQTFLESQAKRS